MPTVDLGPFGAILRPDADDLLSAAAEVEALGFATITLTGGPLAGLHQIADVVRATRSARVVTGILPVVRFGVDEVSALYRELEAEHPGRFVVGLGGAHGPQPIARLTAYLDALDAVPVERRVLSALGPRMLDLAREKTAGALPVYVTPEYTAQARAALGGDTSLVVMQMAAVAPDPATARDLARGPLRFMATMPAYQASFHRMGFTDDEVATLADRLVEALAACGDVDAVAGRLRAQQRAGADHVTVSIDTGVPGPVPVEAYRQVAEVLELRPSAPAS